MSQSCGSYPCSAVIGSGGGYVEVTAGREDYFKVTIPAGALTGDVTIGVALPAGTPVFPSGHYCVSKARELTPHNQTFQAGYKARIDIGYARAMVPDQYKSNVRLYISNKAILDPLGWMPIAVGDCVFDANGELDYARLANFSKWYVAVGYFI
jgi:hypothetical protein